MPQAFINTPRAIFNWASENKGSKSQKTHSYFLSMMKNKIRNKYKHESIECEKLQEY